MKLLFLILFSLFFSCGKSPFLKTPSSEQRVILPQMPEEGLYFENEKLNITHYFSSEINIGEEVTVAVVFSDAQGRLKDPKAHFSMKLWMPDMGHGSFPITIKKVSTGIYEARDLFFTMPGYWDIHFELKKEDQVIDEVLWGIDL